MNILRKLKDGGPNSPVDCYFLCEFKSLFSVGVLRFSKGGRESFHSHAFDAFTWFLYGDLLEECVTGSTHKYKRSIFPKRTLKAKTHRVKAFSTSWCLTVRGPWKDRWVEIKDNKHTTLTHGRQIVSEEEYFK